MATNNKKEKDGPTDHGLIARLVEAAIVFFVCCGLIRLGVSYLVSVRIPLIIIAVILATAVIIYRVFKWRDHDDF